VADFRPQTVAEQKIKKQADGGGLTLVLDRTDDILLAASQERRQSGRPLVMVGFAAESQDILANGQKKLAAKGLDMLVANDITALDAGFAVDTNRVTFLYADGRQEPQPLLSKTRVAEAIVTRAAALLPQT